MNTVKLGAKSCFEYSMDINKNDILPVRLFKAIRDAVIGFLGKYTVNITLDFTKNIATKNTHRAYSDIILKAMKQRNIETVPAKSHLSQPHDQSNNPKSEPGHKNTKTSPTIIDAPPHPAASGIPNNMNTDSMLDAANSTLTITPWLNNNNYSDNPTYLELTNLFKENPLNHLKILSTFTLLPPEIKDSAGKHFGSNKVLSNNLSQYIATVITNLDVRNKEENTIAKLKSINKLKQFSPLTEDQKRKIQEQTDLVLESIINSERSQNDQNLINDILLNELLFLNNKLSLKSELTAEKILISIPSSQNWPLLIRTYCVLNTHEIEMTSHPEKLGCDFIFSSNRHPNLFKDKHEDYVKRFRGMRLTLAVLFFIIDNHNDVRDYENCKKIQALLESGINLNESEIQDVRVTALSPVFGCAELDKIFGSPRLEKKAITHHTSPSIYSFKCISEAVIKIDSELNRPINERSAFNYTKELESFEEFEESVINNPLNKDSKCLLRNILQQYVDQSYFWLYNQELTHEEISNGIKLMDKICRNNLDITVKPSFTYKEIIRDKVEKFIDEISKEIDEKSDSCTESNPDSIISTKLETLILLLEQNQSLSFNVEAKIFSLLNKITHDNNNSNNILNFMSKLTPYFDLTSNQLFTNSTDTPNRLYFINPLHDSLINAILCMDYEFAQKVVDFGLKIDSELETKIMQEIASKPEINLTEVENIIAKGLTKPTSQT